MYELVQRIKADIAGIGFPALYLHKALERLARTKRTV